MNKGEFVNYIAEKQNCSKVEAEKIIDVFTSSVVNAIGEGQDVSLIGFGSYYVTAVPARSGRNPTNGNIIQIPARNQPKFKVGQKLKDACNK